MKPLIVNIQQALKQNLIPGICLQIFALALALAYFKWPAAAPVFNAFAELKLSYGWGYSLVATAIFGGLIPFAYLWFTGLVRSAVLPILLFYVFFWAYKGVEVDLFYSAQAHWFGTGSDWPTLIKKTLVDQFIYGTFWAAPTMAIGYAWKEAGFSFSRLRGLLNRDFFFLQIPTTLVTNWLIWIPAVLIIYSMPMALQIPLFNLVLCFFVLLLTTISQRKPEA
ncbi:hypothetical protein [Marinagarivorans cellulosilyticus]|uniref:Uncharacterized protein n=1 Tax=Marinagarivorans cellulosilyticus TaxID=2721545 RepID=A0AAN2BIL2_9GAMM|nr:hypothetical protein [Marinagarivorans cellulosilyticus]BCD95989.1 hypothetical protein MARGE09_P0188 [Marinagarivorans cellulosilyticus]